MNETEWNKTAGAQTRAVGSNSNEELASGRIERRFAWLIDQIAVRFPGSIDPLSSRPPEISALEAIDKMILGEEDWKTVPLTEFEALERDAKRYRWLRDAGQDTVDVFFATENNASRWGCWDSWDDKDAAIDSVMLKVSMGSEGCEK